MNINSKEIFIDLQLKKNEKHLFLNEINRRVSSLSKTVSNCYFSDLDDSSINEYFLKKKKQIQKKNQTKALFSDPNQVYSYKKSIGTKIKYYLKGASDIMLIGSMLKTPLLLTTELSNKQSCGQCNSSNNKHSVMISAPMKLFKGDHTTSASALGISQTLRSFTMPQQWKTAKAILKSASTLSFSKRRKTTSSSSDNIGAMVMSPIFTPLKKKYTVLKKIDFYAQFNLFERKPMQKKIHRITLIERTNTIGNKQRLNSSITMKRIEGLMAKSFKIGNSNEDDNNKDNEDKDDVNGMRKMRNYSSRFLRMLKLKQQKEVMREIENLIDYSESKKNYETEQIEKIQNLKKMQLLSRINNNLIYNNIQYFKSQYCISDKERKR